MHRIAAVSAADGATISSVAGVCTDGGGHRPDFAGVALRDAVARPVVRSAGFARGQRGVVAGIFSAACLLPPTILMGATLPAIARWVEATPRGVAWLGFFYGGNTGGAVLGSLLSGFVLLRLCDMSTAMFVAIGINASVALGAAAFVGGPRGDAGPTPRRATDRAPSGPVSIYLAVGLSGASALGAEVVWTRLLSLLLGGTVYTFSLILAVFLLGWASAAAAGGVGAHGSVVPTRPRPTHDSGLLPGSLQRGDCLDRLCDLHVVARLVD